MKRDAAAGRIPAPRRRIPILPPHMKIIFEKERNFA